MSCIEGVIMGRVGDVVLRVGQTLVAVMAGRVWDCAGAPCRTGTPAADLVIDFEGHMIDFDLSNITDNLMRKADRRDFLCANVPKCTSCSTYQVQLMDADNQPALWRCRVCKHAFYYEPMSK
jgi:hypothetical protein